MESSQFFKGKCRKWTFEDDRFDFMFGSPPYEDAQHDSDPPDNVDPVGGEFLHGQDNNQEN